MASPRLTQREREYLQDRIEALEARAEGRCNGCVDHLEAARLRAWAEQLQCQTADSEKRRENISAHLVNAQLAAVSILEKQELVIAAAVAAEREACAKIADGWVSDYPVIHKISDAIRNRANLQPCGHLPDAIVCNLKEGTAYCGACQREHEQNR